MWRAVACVLFVCCSAVFANVTPRGERRVREVFAWRQMDFKYPSDEVRRFAIEEGSFVPENAINPIGVAAAGSRVFITMPRWKHGVPATLATVNYNPSTAAASSPALTPYPDWSWNRVGNCEGLTSVYRVKVDECGRLWAVDTGVINSFNQAQRICPPQVVAFDLSTDKMVYRYRFPQVSCSFSMVFSTSPL